MNTAREGSGGSLGGGVSPGMVDTRVVGGTMALPAEAKVPPRMQGWNFYYAPTFTMRPYTGA